jgi:PTS system nitrogen regulatory IIA component
LHKRFGLDAASIARQLEAREKLGSTGLGLGIALPHARIPGLSSSHMVFIRLQQPIAFDAPDGKPVGKFLLLLVPENAGHDHLQALADAAKMFGHRPFREKLRIASSAQELSLLLRQHAI